MVPDPREHLQELIVDALLQEHGEVVARMVRSMGMQRPNWTTARKEIGRASTWLITFERTEQYKEVLVHEFAASVMKHLFNAGFTAEELIPPLTLLAR